MSEVGSAFVSIMASAKGFGRSLDSQVGPELDKAGKSGGKRFGGALKVGAAGAVAGAAIGGAFLKSTIGAASEAQQSIGATETVFGKFADTVIKSSGKAAGKFGLSANTYRENANLIGSLFKNQGVSTDELAGKTDKMIGVGADLAATFGGTTTDAVGALGSAFKGEYDSLENYGISLKESSVSALLAARGQDKLKGSAAALAKQTAVSDLIMRQSKDSVGAAARESNTYAAQQQKLGANFENLKTTIGTAFLPILTRATSALNGMFTKIGPAAVKVGAFLAPAKRAIEGLFSGPVGAGATSLMGTFTSIANSVKANFLPVLRSAGETFKTVILPAVTSAASYIGSKLMPVLSQVGGIIATKVVPIRGTLARFFYEKVIPAVVKIAASVGKNLKPVFDTVVSVIQGKVLPAVSKLLTKFQQWWPTISRVVMVVVKVTGKVLEFASAILGKVLPPVIKFAGFLIGKLFSAIGTVIGIIVKIVGKVMDFGRALIDGGKKAADFAGKVKEKVGDAIDFIKDIPGKAKDALSNLGSTLFNAGASLIQGLIDGIQSKIDAVGRKMSELASKIKGFLPGSPVKEGPLVSWNNGAPGKQLVSMGIIDGIDSQQAAIAASMHRLTSRVAVPKPRVDLGAAGAYGSGSGAGGAVTVNVDTINARDDEAAMYEMRTQLGRMVTMARY